MQRCVLSAVRLPTLFVLTGNPINSSRKRAGAYTTKLRHHAPEMQEKKRSKLN